MESIEILKDIADFFFGSIYRLLGFIFLVIILVNKNKRESATKCFVQVANIFRWKPLNLYDNYNKEKDEK
ncbi:hypothetical protein [Flavimarina sp. Hel_I_48]|uniref:hypothetical protein n=1 Tax=Flavimarina sp. Hel_I_48 TaxID=1392488 RepID=UPI0004DF90CB|nr:hypothetical protein [Flavimarina sp. Hel_I_48]